MPTSDESEAARHELTRRKYIAEAEIMAIRVRQGAAIAKHFGYGDLDGIDAIHRYLIETYHWLPSQVRALTHDELDLLLAGVEFPDGAAPKGRTSGSAKRGPRLTR